MASILTYTTEEEYKNHFIEIFVNNSPILTHDGIEVFFWESDFEHAFYQRSEKSWASKKSTFSLNRATKMDYILDMLNDSSLIAYQGYDKACNSHDNESRSVVLTTEMLLLVIRHAGPNKARFKTMFVIDNQITLKKIISNPIWVNTWK